MATAQQLSSLAVGLKAAGHEVTVIAGDRGYDDPAVRFPKRENWNGIDIIRVSSLSLGKQTKLRRALNFASFFVACAARLLTLKRCDRVVALTSPPLISALGALFTQLKGGKFYFWVMDLNPDEAIAAGWLKADSLAAKVLQRVLVYSMRRAERIVVLDRFMKERVEKKGIAPEKIAIIPPWSLTDGDAAVAFDQNGRDEFRSRHKLTPSFVVMYSGNHSPCHPLDTLLDAAKVLRRRTDIDFYFVGGGSEQARVRRFAAREKLRNIHCLPYQQQSHLAASLSAADLHVVVMGEPFVGIVHPCKLYNVLSVGAPVLYIGPEKSCVTDIAAELNGGGQFYHARHGEVERVVEHIRAASSAVPPPRKLSPVIDRFSQSRGVAELMRVLR